MTAKEEILQLMKQVPDGLTFAETIDRLRSAYAAKDGAGASEKGKASAGKYAPPNSAPPPLDGQAIKEEIVAIMARLSDDLTAAEAVCEAADDLRLFFLIQKDFEDIREGRVFPFEERDDEPVFLEEVPEIGSISSEEFNRMTIKEKLVHTMQLLPEDLSLGQAVYEALERLLFMYNLEKSFESIRRGETYTMEEVRQMMQEWRE